jgi:hypothetical protein
MAPNTQPIFILKPNMAEVTFVNADGTTEKDLNSFVSGAADGGKVFAINVTSDDTATVEMQVLIHDGTTAFLLGTVDVPTLAGTDGSTPAKNLLDPTLVAGLDSDGELFVPTGYKLQVRPKAAVTATKTVTVIGHGGQY